MINDRDLRADSGATLVEMLVALVILSTAGLAVMVGLQLSITVSDMHRKQASGGAFVRNYAEALQDWVADGNYVPCGGAGNYEPATVGFAEPDGYVADYDTPVPLAGDGSEVGCGADAGVQRVRLTMASSDGRATEELIVVLRRPCAPGGAAC